MMQTNFEHYKDEILKITNFNGGGLAMLKSDHVILSNVKIACLIVFAQIHIK